MIFFGDIPKVDIQHQGTFMLEQSIETLTQPTATEIPLTQPVETAIPEATETVIPQATDTSMPISAPNTQIAATNQAMEGGFNIEIVKERLPADLCNTCMISNSDLLLAPEPGKDADIKLDTLVISPRKYLIYERLELTPGTSNPSKETAYAFDGKTDVEGIEYTKEEYLTKVRERFPKARWVERGAIVGRYISSKPTNSSTDVPLTSRDLVQVYLAPSSVRAFQSLVTRIELNAKDGIISGNCLELGKMQKNSNNHQWTQFTFKDVHIDTKANLTSNS